ncbi:MAG: MotA/TolQ/ExbB proton channel family protein [Bacteroidales bacterium]|nr:MotA/TolQ/ExbB proton channel family protein [Bacteroidales bacterium]MCQ2315851.1 MotA/TolQ/ExbB proton channel family protein [Bacteroidales bacterium]
MKKLFALLTVAGFLTFGISNTLLAQEENAQPVEAQTEQVAETPAVEPAAPAQEVAPVQSNPLAAPETDATFHEVLKKQFIDGGWGFMSVILLILVLGLAVSIERIIYLTLSTTNTKKLLTELEATLNKGGVEKAKDLCRNTRGPVASIFYQGLMRYNDGLEEVEKSIVSYGSVMTGNLESGASWISLFIALGPMLGFMGTVIGMIAAFDAIAAAGDISPTVVAGGMKVALLTTVFGLIVAVILQICYNFILNKIEGIVNDMEDSSITFMDMLHAYSKKN